MQQSLPYCSLITIVKFELYWDWDKYTVHEDPAKFINEKFSFIETCTISN